jgi:hypothetical protein
MNSEATPYLRDLLQKFKAETVKFITQEERDMQVAVEKGDYSKAAMHRAEARGLRVALRCMARVCSRSMNYCDLQHEVDLE